MLVSVIFFSMFSYVADWGRYFCFYLLSNAQNTQPTPLYFPSTRPWTATPRKAKKNKIITPYACTLHKTLHMQCLVQCADVRPLHNLVLEWAYYEKPLYKYVHYLCACSTYYMQWLMIIWQKIYSAWIINCMSVYGMSMLLFSSMFWVYTHCVQLILSDNATQTGHFVSVCVSHSISHVVCY